EKLDVAYSQYLPGGRPQATLFGGSGLPSAVMEQLVRSNKDLLALRDEHSLKRVFEDCQAATKHGLTSPELEHLTLIVRRRLGLEPWEASEPDEESDITLARRE